MRQPFDERFDRAVSAARQGKLDEAQRICRDILSESPDHVGANLMLGIAAARSGNEDEAVTHFATVLSQDPNNFEALKWLAGALNRQGRFLEAGEAAEPALQLRPDDFAVQLARASALYGTGRWDESAEAHRRAIELDPKREPAYFGLYQTHLRRGDPVAARAALLDAAHKVPSPKLYVHLAEVCLQCGLPEEAAKWAQGVPQGTPEEAPALVHMAAAFRNAGNPEMEEHALNRLATVDPHNPALYLLRGFQFHVQGRFEEAEREFLRSIELMPRQGGAYHSIVTGRRMTENDLPLIRQMEEIAAAGGLKTNEAAPLEFALGKSFEDLGRYGEAMEHFLAGNRMMRDHIMGPRSFDRKGMAREIELTIDLFTREFLRDHLGKHKYSPTPIMIAGAMRSGTTLLEQILSSHPRVGAAGEQVFWRRAVRECWVPDPFDPEAGVLHDVIRTKADDYVAMLREFGPRCPFITDKEPANHRLFGIIRLALPNSPLIQLRRNLADVALSMFTTHFQTGEEYVWDRDDITFALKQHARLAAHWRAAMPPDRFLEVDYAELVTRPEPTIRGILEFCGLEWDDACMRSQENERTVNTPSFWQVRQPINPGSVERWRRYEPWLGPFSDLVDVS